MELLHTGIDKCGVAGPTGCGVNHVCAALANFLNDGGVNIIALVFIGKDMPMLHIGTQILTDVAIEVGTEGVTQACTIGQRSHIAVLVAPFVHSEHITVTAADIVAVDHFRNRLVGTGPLVGENSGQMLIQHVREINAVENILYEDLDGIDYDLNAVTVLVGVLHILSLNVTYIIQNFGIAGRQPTCRLEIKFIIILCHFSVLLFLVCCPRLF